MGMAIGAGAQQRTADLRLFGLVSAPGVAALDLPAPQVRLLMPPQLALQTYEANAERQLSDLGYSSDVTVIEAALPGTGQKGRFELRRSFMAPKSLVYGAIKFAGDNFINLRDAIDDGSVRPGDRLLLFAYGYGAHWTALALEA